MIKSQQLWFTAPYSVEYWEQQLGEPGPDEILVRTLYSAVSAGTEMLAYRGQLPPDQALDVNLECLENQSTSYPLQYGYANVGRVEAAGDKVDQGLIGRHVFALQSHATHYICKAGAVVKLAETIDPEAAVFLANMETAVNLVLDAKPALGDQVVILGQGVVGLLVSAILSRFPLSACYALEPLQQRRDAAVQLGIEKAIDPDNEDDMGTMRSVLDDTPGRGADLVFELTGAPDALNLALSLCAYTGRIVVGSWYGIKPVTLDLGGRFHRERIEIISSQVSTISPELTGRWDRKRRFVTALELIESVKPEQLITHRVAYACAQEAYKLLDESPDKVLQVILTYPH